jgi:prepilin-type N-terminal cleavage/methylation domain-containing protein
MYSHKGFTLIELLVVLAIIAVLAVVVVLVLNPAELLRQSRDSQRLSDMSTLDDAINFYAANTGGGMGTSSVTPILRQPRPREISVKGLGCSLSPRDIAITALPLPRYAT